MKMKKIIAMLGVVSMLVSVSPMAMAADYEYDPATNTYTLTETVVPGDIVVKTAGADDSEYASSTEVKFTSGTRNFDFKATLDMDVVAAKFLAAMELADSLNKDLTALDEREVEGEFTVTVIPGTYISIPDADKNGTNMYGFTTDSENYVEKGRQMQGGNLVITVGLKSGLKVKDLKETNSFADIAYESENVAVTKAGKIKIKGTVNGWIQTKGTVNARAEFVAKEDGNEVIEATIKSESGGGVFSGGGGTTTTKYDVKFNDGSEVVHSTKVNKSDVVDLSTIAVPESEDNKIFIGWYKDADLKEKAAAKETITKNTTFYAGWIDTKINIGFYVDGVKVPVNTGTTGSVVVGTEDIVVGEGSVEVKLDGITVVGSTIEGWFMDADYTTAADASVTITEDTSFYASTKEIVAPPVLDAEDHFAYIIGYPEGDVRPENSITREEVATIFFRLLTDETRNANMTSSNSFADVDADRWSNNAISTMAALNIINGYENGTFAPSNNITRAEFATIAARFDDSEVAGVKFADVDGHWAESYIEKAAGLQWINGYEDNTFRPDNNITRAEVMAIVNRMLKRDVSVEYIHADAIRWSDNAEAAWYYTDVIEATNSHEYERLVDGQVEERWTALLPNRDWAALEN